MTLGATFLQTVAGHSDELWLRTGEHLMLTGVSTGLAIAIGIPLGIVAAKVNWLRGPLISCVGILQTVPSLAMLAILLALLQQIGPVPAIIALTLYALLPIMRNTQTGLMGLPAPVLEAAQGIGMTPRQQLWKVELPLALPVIVAGIRTAAVVGVGIATLSAFIGAGGLGQFINRGLALNNTQLILLGAIPAAVLALFVDGSIAAFQWGLTYARTPKPALKGPVGRALRPVALALPALIVFVGCIAYFGGGSGGSPAIAAADAGGDAKPVAKKIGTIRIGSKNFAEQLILGELMAQLIEAKTDLIVERKLNMAGTMICHGAMTTGAIDCYAEYTGTALTAILKKEVIADPDKAYVVVQREYKKQFACEWLVPFGFNNTFALTMRSDDAAARKITSLSELQPAAGDLAAGFTAEFSERPDGYPGLQKTYGLRFKSVSDLDPSIMYAAVDTKQVDVICAFATDGRIAALHLQPLVDDKGFFPPYYAAPVVRMATLKKYPAIRDALEPLGGRITDEIMQKLNYEVDGHKRLPRDVAHEFLVQEKLIEP